MTITFRSITNSSLLTGTIAFTKPTGTITGDMMIAFVTGQATSVALTIVPPDATWILLETQNPSTNKFAAALYWHLAVDGEPASYTFTFGGVTMTQAEGSIASYGCTGNARLIDGHASTLNASSSNVKCNGFTTGYSNTTLVFGGLTLKSATFTPATSFTERADFNSGSTLSVEIADFILTTAGGTGTITATASGGGAINCGFCVGINDSANADRNDTITGFDSVVSAGSGGVGTSSLTFAYPLNLVAGDLLLLFAMAYTGTKTVTTPTGWTVISHVTGTGGIIYVLGKIADGSEVGSITVVTTTTEWDMYMTRISSYNITGTGNLSDSYTAVSSVTGGSPITCPAQTIGFGEFAIAVAAEASVGVTGTVTGTGWTKQTSGNESTIGSYVIARGLPTASGISPVFTMTGGANGCALSFKIIPWKYFYPMLMVVS